MIEHATMENGKDMYEATLRMSKMVDIMYDTYERRIEKEEKEESEINVSSTPSSEYSFPSPYSHHSNEEINLILQADNTELKVLLLEEK